MFKQLKKAAIMVTLFSLCAVVFGVGSPVQAAGYYSVQPGDTLFSIASRYDVSISELATLNHIYDVNAIYVGQVLALPNPLPPGYYPTYPIYTPPPVYIYRPTPPIYYGSVYIRYVVQPGDFLNAIAERFNTTGYAILTTNNIADANLLYIGQVLLIPYVSAVAPPIRPPVYGNFYVVQPGDTLSSIGQRFNRDIYNIARVNGLLNLNAIYAGMSLLIP